MAAREQLTRSARVAFKGLLFSGATAQGLRAALGASQGRPSERNVAGRNRRPGQALPLSWWWWCLAGVLVAVLLATLFPTLVRHWPWPQSLLPTGRCLVPSSALLMEALRPPADCSFCASSSKGPEELPLGTAPEEARAWFAPLAYSGRPAVARGAARDWPAREMGLDLAFFRDLYLQTPGALEAVEEDCQFLPLGSEFGTLAQALAMDEERARKASPPFYFGWSNCHPQVAQRLRQLYRRPSFLPVQAEASALDWVFLGGFGPGAALHLDYVRRPSWQAQVSGKKSWLLLPPAECEDVCSGLNLTVETGDVVKEEDCSKKSEDEDKPSSVLVDTNLWFHTTYVHEGDISVTIGSEYD